MLLDSALRAKYLKVWISGFFSFFLEKFSNFLKFSIKIAAMFGSTDVNKQLFSFMKLTKNVSENKADWLTLVISDQIWNCTDTSARHTKNVNKMRDQAAEQNTRNDWLVVNKFSFFDYRTFCTMYMFYLKFSKWLELVIMNAVSYVWLL